MCRGKIHKMLKINNLRAFFSPFLGWRLARRGGFWVVLGSLCAMMACCGGDGRDRPENRKNGDIACTDSVSWDSMEYSRLFRLGSRCGVKVAEIRSILGADSLVRRVEVREPFRRVVVLSSAQIGFMARLGVTDRIVGVGEGKYIVDSTLLARVTAGEVAEVGYGQSISLEKVLALKPDLVMTFATGGSHDDYERLQPLGIPLFVTSEWQESDPLAKLEWIKLFGLIFGVETLADSIYRQTKEEYLSTLVYQRSGLSSDAPLVIAGMAYGGVWYAPGGNSYTAHLIRAAGGRYLWACHWSKYTSTDWTFIISYNYTSIVIKSNCTTIITMYTKISSNNNCFNNFTFSYSSIRSSFFNSTYYYVTDITRFNFATTKYTNY